MVFFFTSSEVGRFKLAYHGLSLAASEEEADYVLRNEAHLHWRFPLLVSQLPEGASLCAEDAILPTGGRPGGAAVKPAVPLALPQNSPVIGPEYDFVGLDGDRFAELVRAYTQGYSGRFFQALRQADFPLAAEFSSHLFRRKRPFLVYLRAAADNFDAVVDFVNATTARNAHYNHFRFLLHTSVKGPARAKALARLPRTSVETGGRSRREVVSGGAYLGELVVFASVDSPPDFWSLNESCAWAAFEAGPHRVVDSGLYSDLSLVSSGNDDDDVDLCFLQPPPSCPDLMRRLEVMLGRRDLLAGLRLIQAAQVSSKTFSEYCTLLMAKLSFVSVSQNFKALDAEIVRAFKVFSRDPETIRRLVDVVLSMDDKLSAEARKHVYLFALQDAAVDRRVRLACVQRALTVNSLSLKDVAAVISAYEALGTRDESCDKLFLERITRSFNGTEVMDCFLSIFLKDRGEAKLSLRSVADFDEMRQRFALFPEIVFRVSTYIDPFLPTRSEVVKRRLEVLASTDVLAACWPETYELDRVFRVFDVNNFQLSYHGLSSRDFFRKKSEFFRRVCPELNYTAPWVLDAPPAQGGGRKKVAFLSDFLTRVHSVYKDRHQIIKHLSEVHDVYVVTLSDLQDEIRLTFGKGTHLKLPESLSKARDLLEALRPDVIVYCEIGMHPFFYFLAHLRLSPLQLNTWGHSDTSGISTVDAFVSSELYEAGPQVCRGNYTEEVVLTKSLCTCYVSPVAFHDVTTFRSRKQLGFSSGTTLYLCPQSLFKLSPEFDEYLFGVLGRDAAGVVVLVDALRQREKLVERWEHGGVSPELLARVRFVDGCAHYDFLNLIAVADVMLDSYPFGGCNSSLEAFSLGTPVVTQPGLLINTRFTTGFYRKMGFTELVVSSVEEYVAAAVRLGTDAEYRSRVRGILRERSPALFLDKQSCEEWADLVAQRP